MEITSDATPRLAAEAVQKNAHTADGGHDFRAQGRYLGTGYQRSLGPNVLLAE